MALTIKIAKKIKGGLASRFRPAMSEDEVVKAYSGTMPHSKPKAAIGPKYKRKSPK